MSKFQLRDEDSKSVEVIFDVISLLGHLISEHYQLQTYSESIDLITHSTTYVSCICDAIKECANYAQAIAQGENHSNGYLTNRLKE